jgi:hypothetical protein
VDHEEKSGKVFRWLLMALSAAVSVWLFATSRDILGLILLAFYYARFIRVADDLITTVLAYSLPLASALLIFWSPYRVIGDVSFLEWAGDNWYFIAIYGSMATYSIIDHFIVSNTTWAILSETYATDVVVDQLPHDTPHADGLMTIEEDFIPVIVYQVADGFLMTTRGKNNLLIPWSRVEETSRRSGDSSRAVLHLRKKLGPPLEIEVPWGPGFTTRTDA